MFKRFLLITLFTLGLSFLFSSKAYAAVDISLEDMTDDNTIEVRINSNNEMLSGIAIDIFFSNGLVVKEINDDNDFCSLGFNSVASNGVISIECLNDERSVFNDTLATITYTTDGSDYYFYVDENSIDIGNNQLGTIIDINKPENVNTETEKENGIDTKETKEDDIVVKIVDFIREYYIYISLAVISISIVLLISFFKKH